MATTQRHVAAEVGAVDLDMAAQHLALVLSRHRLAEVAKARAEQLLRQILQSGDVVGQDGAGRTVVRLAVDRATLDRLIVFGADAAECEDHVDDEPYESPPVHACWLEAA
jgi:hypothetical protein